MRCFTRPDAAFDKAVPEANTYRDAGILQSVPNTTFSNTLPTSARAFSKASRNSPAGGQTVLAMLKSYSGENLEYPVLPILLGPLESDPRQLPGIGRTTPELVRIATGRQEH